MNFTFRHILTLALFAILWPHLNAGIAFRHFDVRDGLDDNYVRAMSRDSFGRLWIVARGVNTFDGLTIRTLLTPADFSPEKVVFDADGGVWTAGHSRILALSGREFTDASSHMLRLGIPPRATDIFSDPSGNLYFITPDSIYYHDFPSGMTHSMEHRGVRTLASSLHGKGLAYSLDSAGNVHEIHMSSGSSHRIAGNIDEARHIQLTDDGRLWLYGGRTYGLRHIGLRSTPATIGSIAVCEHYLINSIAPMADGRMAVGTNNDGILLLSPEGDIVDRIFHHSNDAYSLASNHVTSLLYDDDALIAGTAKCGFDIADMNGPHISRCEIDIDEDISFFHELPDGSLLIGTDGKGLALFSAPGASSHRHVYDRTNSSLTSPSVIGIAPLHDGSLLLGTYGGGIYCMTDDRLEQAPISSDSLRYVRHMLEASDSTVWAGTFADGLFHPGHHSYSMHNSPLRTDCITGLALKGDTILVATSTGLYGIAPGRHGIFVIRNDGYLNTAVIYTMLVDSRGLTWLGNADGLRVYDRNFRLTATLTLTDGLSDNTVRALTEDLNGDIWLTGNNGLSHVTVRHGDRGDYHFTATPYSASDGLGDITFNRYAISCLSDGRILAGGLGRYVIITPNDASRRHSKERVRISALTVNGHPVGKGEAVDGGMVPLTTDAAAAGSITLSYSHSFTIGLSTFDLVNSDKVRYEYNLDNRGWIHLNGNTCSFSEMSSGRHILQVRTSGSPEVTEITLDIRPPLWRSDMALAIYAVILALICAATVSYVRKRNRRSLHRQMMEKTFLRQENAPLNRDEAFLAQAKAAVDANISDETFGVERLSEALAMSRSNLYKKIQALTDKTPIEFIRLIRIREGKKLLDEGEETGVAQAAYRVGLSPKQFSKYFKEEYGTLPSVYINRLSSCSD